MSVKDDDQSTATKGDLKKMKTEIISEVKEHFNLAIEIIRADLLGANRDEIEVIKDRVTRLEDHTGVLRA